jgi:uncharacterized protein (DUF3084 family)
MNKHQYFNEFYHYLYLAKVYGLDNVYKVGVTRKYSRRIKSLIDDSPHGFEYILVFSSNNVYTKEQDMISEFPSHCFDVKFPGSTEYIIIEPSVISCIDTNELQDYTLCHTWRP